MRLNVKKPGVPRAFSITQRRFLVRHPCLCCIEPRSTALGKDRRAKRGEGVSDVSSVIRSGIRAT